MTVKELADKLKKFNADSGDIDWLLQQPTAETAILMACDESLEVVMNLISPTSWAEYERITGPAWAEYERTCDASWAEYKRTCDASWAEYEGIRATARIELLEALEKA